MPSGIYTISINKTAFGSFTTRAAAVPVDGPSCEAEEFCNVAVDGTAAHASVLGVLGLAEDDARLDPVLL